MSSLGIVERRIETVDRFQERLERKLGLEDPTREEVQAKIDTFTAALDDYEEQRVFGHVYYARRQ